MLFHKKAPASTMHNLTAYWAERVALLNRRA